MKTPPNPKEKKFQKLFEEFQRLHAELLELEESARPNPALIMKVHAARERLERELLMKLHLVKDFETLQEIQIKP
jgi:hypothetical protein